MSEHYLVLFAIFLVLGGAILVIAAKYLLRFSTICTSIMTFGAFLALYGVFVAITGETGGYATHRTDRINGSYAVILGAILVTVGFLLKKISSVWKP